MGLIMAGDWIKFQKDTPDKPEVLAIAARMGMDPDAVVGKLIRIWSWFDTHTTNGNALSVTYSFLDRLTGVTGFSEHVALVGWLEQNGSELSLPNFEYHNGETAKKRAMGKNRTEKHRNNPNSDAESNDSSVTKTSPEKRREEKSINKNTATIVAAPEGVSESVWNDFVRHRKAKRAQVTGRVIEAISLQAKLAGWTLEAALAETIDRNWQTFKAAWVDQKPAFQNKFDVSRTTIPARPDRDPALLKADQDLANARPPSLEVLAKMAALRKAVQA